MRIIEKKEQVNETFIRDRFRESYPGWNRGGINSFLNQLNAANEPQFEESVLQPYSLFTNKRWLHDVTKKILRDRPSIPYERAEQEFIDKMLHGHYDPQTANRRIDFNVTLTPVTEQRATLADVTENVDIAVKRLMRMQTQGEISFLLVNTYTARSGKRKKEIIESPEQVNDDLKLLLDAGVVRKINFDEETKQLLTGPRRDNLEEPTLDFYVKDMDGKTTLLIIASQTSPNLAPLLPYITMPLIYDKELKESQKQHIKFMLDLFIKDIKEGNPGKTSDFEKLAQYFNYFFDIKKEDGVSEQAIKEDREKQVALIKGIQRSGEERLQRYINNYDEKNRELIQAIDRNEREKKEKQGELLLMKANQEESPVFDLLESLYSSPFIEHFEIYTGNSHSYIRMMVQKTLDNYEDDILATILKGDYLDYLFSKLVRAGVLDENNDTKQDAKTIITNIFINPKVKMNVRQYVSLDVETGALSFSFNDAPDLFKSTVAPKYGTTPLPNMHLYHFNCQGSTVSNMKKTATSGNYHMYLPIILNSVGNINFADGVVTEKFFGKLAESLSPSKNRTADFTDMEGNPLTSQQALAILLPKTQKEEVEKEVTPVPVAPDGVEVA